MAKKILSIPAAARTFDALRDLGYNMNSAVADVIDNSITQGKAKNISVVFSQKRKNSFGLSIFDDGIGMTSTRLEESMRLGSSGESYGKRELSKYGMGMKTASLSQCQKLTVVSSVAHKPSGFMWDLDHVDRTNKWELLQLSTIELKGIINSALATLVLVTGETHAKFFQGKSWTMVAWDNLEEFQNNYDSYEFSGSAEQYYLRSVDKLEIYLRTIFGRFIDGENDARKINLFVNGSKLKSLDPFCRSEEHTIEKILAPKHGNFIIDENIKTPIVIKRYILPTNPAKPGAHSFSSGEKWSEAKGIHSWNDAQGYYFYRNNRLISSGGWFGIRAKDEHEKLARVSIDLTEDHDRLFKIDVKKSRIYPPEIFKNHLIDNVNKGFTAEARARYDKNEKKKPVINNVRKKGGEVKLLSEQLITQNQIEVREDVGGRAVIVHNQMGKLLINDTTYKTLEAGITILSAKFGNDDLFWKMVPTPESGFQVLINENHPFYNEVYGNHKKDKKTTAIVDAFLFTMCFIELKCITRQNETLFEQMREVASEVLKKFVAKKIL